MSLVVCSGHELVQTVGIMVHALILQVFSQGTITFSMGYKDSSKPKMIDRYEYVETSPGQMECLVYLSLCQPLRSQTPCCDGKRKDCTMNRCLFEVAWP